MSDSNATYTKIHIQLVFAVKFRDALLRSSFKEEVYKYISGIVQNHVHIFIGLRPNEALSKLVNEIKLNSSKFINEKKFLPVRFEWQKDYGAFSYGKWQVKLVIEYIKNQEKHHCKKSFLEEYKGFLEKFGVDYKQEYIFNELV